MEEALKTLEAPVTYTGLHFLGAEQYPSTPITEQEFEAAWQGLADLVKTL